MQPALRPLVRQDRIDSVELTMLSRDGRAEPHPKFVDVNAHPMVTAIEFPRDNPPSP